MLKARESVFWPGISDDIWKTVEQCGICQLTSRAVKPVGNVSEVPPHAWHTLPSLDTLGAIRDYQLTQRRLKL